MNIRQKVNDLVHGTVFASVCFLMATSFLCPEKPNNAPNDDNATYKLGYCAQIGMNAFAYAPPEGEITYVKNKFSAAKKSVGIKFGSQTLPLTSVLKTPDGFYAYWYDNCLRNDRDEVICQFQFFAIESFIDANGVVLDTLAGVTHYGAPIFFGNISVYVAVGTLRTKYAALSPENSNKGITKTTIHELGHLAVDLKDCWESPASHVARDCVMTDSRVMKIGNDYFLMNVCGIDVLGFRDDFCSYCRESIGFAKIVPAP